MFGVYELVNKSGRKSYKIFAGDAEMLEYLKKNKDKSCTDNRALFRANGYKEFPNTEIRKLTKKEAEDYWNKRF